MLVAIRAWGWMAPIYPFGIVLFLLVVSVLIPVRLSSLDGANREKAQSAFARAGCIACLLAHVAMAGVLYEGWQDLATLGPLVTPTDYARVIAGALEPAAAGWGALAWTLLLVGLHSLPMPQWRPALVAVEALALLLVILLLGRTMPDPSPPASPVPSVPVQLGGNPEDLYVPEEARINISCPPLVDSFPLPLVPLACLTACAGLFALILALTSWVRARRGAKPESAERARRLLAGIGLCVLSASLVWLIGLLKGSLEYVVRWGAMGASLDNVTRDFLSRSWPSGIAAFLGLLALCFGALHLRPRAGRGNEGKEATAGAENPAP